MSINSFARPAFLSSVLVALLVVFAACGAAATPTTAPTEAPSPTAAEPTEAPSPAEAEPTAMAPTEAPTTAPTDAEPAPAAMPGEGVEVQPARPTWNTGYFSEAIYSLALEELGYEVNEHQELDNPIFYQSVAQGDVDFWTEGWFPLHNQYRDVFEQGATIAGTWAEAGALEGYLVDKAGADEFGISSLDDFKRDEVKQAYDANSNGKAELVGCPPGWGCNTVIGFHLDTFGLRDHVDEITSDYSAGMADAIGRFQNGEHILFYTWTPNWTVNALKPGEDVVWIEVPRPQYPEEDVTEDQLSAAGVEGCVNDPCLLGFPANDISVVANQDFLDNNPAAAKLFEVVSIPLEDVFAQNARMHAGEDSQADIDRHAQEWAEANQEMWNSWLEQARQAAAG
jgi:glycine betaine/proline transport system substrate-binding protein